MHTKDSSFQNSAPTALIGFGTLGQHIYDMLKSKSDDINSVIIFDDLACQIATKDRYPFSNYSSDNFKSSNFYICLGYKSFRIKEQIFEKLQSARANIMTYVHPTAYVHTSSVVSDGSIIFPLGNLDRNTWLGTGVVLHNSVVISHDSRIGAYSYLSPGITVCGNVSVGKRCFLGAGAIVCNSINIGDDCVIGAGTVVTQDIPDMTQAVGNPMRILDHPLKLI